MTSPQWYGRPFWIIKGCDRYLIHARQHIYQAVPKDRRNGKLEPGRCVGTWYFANSSIGEPLLQLDREVEGLFLKIAQRKANSLDRESAAYLRQLIDNFLYDLYIDRQTGNFGNPIALHEIENAPILNALRNMQEGTHWKRGAAPFKTQIPVRAARPQKEKKRAHSVEPSRRVRQRRDEENAEAGPSKPRPTRGAFVNRRKAREAVKDDAITISSDSEKNATDSDGNRSMSPAPDPERTYTVFG